MSLAPSGHQHKDWPQALSMSSQRIFNARWHLSVHLPVNDIVALELTQPLRKHFLSRSRQQLLQVAESACPILKVKQDQRLPFSANDFRGDSDRAVEFLYRGFSSGTRLRKGAYWRERDFSLISPSRLHAVDADACSASVHTGPLS